jgi:hypothetical protein
MPLPTIIILGYLESNIAYCPLEKSLKNLDTEEIFGKWVSYSV